MLFRSFIFPHGGATPWAVDGRVALLLLGVGASATVGQLFLTKAFASSGAPASVGVVGLTQIVFVMVIDRALNPRGLEWHSVLGTLLVVAPTVWLLLRRGVAAPAKLVAVTPRRTRRVQRARRRQTVKLKRARLSGGPS